MNNYKFDSALKHFDRILVLKNRNKTFEEIIYDLGVDDNDVQQVEFIKIMYQYSDDKFTAELKMKEYFEKSFPIKSNNTVNIENLKTIILLKTEASNGNLNKNEIILLKNKKDSIYPLERFHSLSKEDLTDLKCKIVKIVKLKTCLVATNGNSKTYDILPVERFKDEFGPWSFDPLCGQMKILVELENGECFPESWKLSEKVNLKKLILN